MMRQYQYCRFRGISNILNKIILIQNHLYRLEYCVKIKFSTLKYKARVMLNMLIYIEKMFDFQLV